MPALRIADLVEATGGALLSGSPETPVSGYEIDARQVAPGAVFFALPGSRADGHDFLDQAARNGAAVAVVQNAPEQDSPVPPGLIRVDDTSAALGRCGAWARGRLKDVRWIAVTGSNGKTTTKELIAEGLAAGRRVHRTPGNLNNHLGAPLSILRCPDDAEYAVIELGMSQASEIAFLTRITDPDIGLVTNVRAAHLEFFGSLDDIAAAKGELFAVLRDDATAVVNLDDVHVRVQAARHAGRRITFGQHHSADLRVEELHNRFLPGVSMTYSHEGASRQLQLRIGGAHAAFDALAALATVAAANEDVEAAARRMECVEAGPGRGQVHRLGRGMVLIDDSYNCSPAALASVLETLRLSEATGRKVLIMGDMLELGRVEGALHREAGKRAASAGVELLVAVGPLSRSAIETARRAGVPEVHHHTDSEKAAESIVEFLKDGDLIVVKGSRAMRMERVVHAVTSCCGEVA